MAVTMLVVFSVLFAATHIIISHGAIRQGLVDKLGEMGFRGVYSLVSLVTLGGAIYFYWGNHGEGALLWEVPGWTYLIVYALVLLAFMLLALMLANPSPAGMAPAAMEPRGVLRVTRHPMNMGVACFALAHVISNGHLGDVAFWGSLFAVGFIGAYHMDRRKAREKGDEFRKFQEQTSILPFAAVIKGKTKLEAGEFSILLLAGAVIGFVVFIFVHGRLFGQAPW